MFAAFSTPIARRRWRVFRDNRRAYISLWGVLALMLVSLSAPLIANDKPLYIHWQGQSYFPLIKDYSGQDFGFLLPGLDYSSPRFQAKLKEDEAVMIWPLIPYRFDTIDKSLLRVPSPPDWQLRGEARQQVANLAERDPATLDEGQQRRLADANTILATEVNWYRQHWLGTDDAGRDIIARFLWGLAVSFVFGACFVTFTSLIGITAGALQGYYGGWVDLVFQRILEVYSGLPYLYIVIALVIIYGSSFELMLGILVFFGWTGFVGITRVEFLRARNLEFVRAARALGVSDGKIMRRHILPNAFIGPISSLPFVFAGSVTVLTSLDYLGFGLPKTWPSLGEMGAQASRFYYNWWQVVGIVAPLSLLTLLIVFVGDGVRQALDPRAIFSIKTRVNDA